jgi:hypothetical protein
MYYNILIMLVFSLGQPFVLFDSDNDSSLGEWRVVDDVVMGGQSFGKAKTTSDGTLLFWGEVSLENNGGFSSVRYNMEGIKASGSTKVILYVKGDGKRYQFRLKESLGQDHSYISYFQTTGDWQMIEIKLKDLYPTWRGRKLSIPNFNGDEIARLAFLIANKKPETFRLEIKRIELH